MHGYSNGKPNKWSQPMQCSKKYNQSGRTLASVGAQRFGLRHHRNHFDMAQVVNHSIWDVICFYFSLLHMEQHAPGYRTVSSRNGSARAISTLAVCVYVCVCHRQPLTKTTNAVVVYNSVDDMAPSICLPDDTRS